MPRRARIPNTTLGWSAAVVAVAAFGLGFALSYDPGPSDPTAAGPTTTAAAPATTSAPTAPTPAPTSTTPTAGPTTVVTTTPTTPTTAAPPPSSVPSTAGPSTTTTGPVVTTVTTAPPTTAPPTPGRVVVTYPQDDRGVMTLRAGGTAAIVLQNQGGTEISYTINVVGPVTIGGATSTAGTLLPGEARNVGITAAPTAPSGPGPHASVAVFTAAGLVVSIPTTVWAPTG